MNSTSDGKLTKMLLKTKSGEFDVDSIHFLVLRDMGLTELGCIGECCSLERLDLTGNRLTRLYALAGLANLSMLNLSNNNISSLEGLQAVDNLQSLNVAGNNLESLESLRWLTGSDHLTELRLRDNVRGLTNPLCDSPTYKADVTAMFPKLSTLDGERLRGKGSEFFKMCDEIETTLKKNSESQRGSENGAIPDPAEWVPQGFWSHSTEKFDQSRLADAEEQLQCLLESCKHLAKQSSEKIQEAMSANSGTR